MRDMDSSSEASSGRSSDARRNDEAIKATFRLLEDRLVSAVTELKKVAKKEGQEGGGTEPPLLKASDLAEMLQISEREIWRMRDSGRLPVPIELGPKNIRWPRAEILDWIEAGCPKRQVWEARKPKAGRGKRAD